MNLDYLKTYLELAKLGSFSAVAKKFSVSQPAISFQIQKLEHDLGLRLINRNHKKFSLTEAGRRLLEFAKAVDGEETSLLRDLGHLRAEVGGELSIAASTTPGEYILPPLLGEFLNRNPAVTAGVAVVDSTAVISGVKEGAYEVGFCGTVPPKGQGLESFRIAEDEIVLVVSPAHPFARRKQVDFVELAEEPLIVREPTSGTQKSIEVLLSEAGLNTGSLRSRLVLGSSHAILSAVEAHAGIAFVSGLAARKSLELGTVRQLTVREIRLKRDFFCIFYTERLATRLTHEFVDFMREKASAGL
ncbi:MAG: LysR family transcriptional regulator [Dehalococcoidia bacterium]|nr:LysR family transcriptional regulator [Dehalococcoidia bacterium]